VQAVHFIPVLKFGQGSDEEIQVIELWLTVQAVVDPAKVPGLSEKRRSLTEIAGIQLQPAIVPVSFVEAVSVWTALADQGLDGLKLLLQGCLVRTDLPG